MSLKIRFFILCLVALGFCLPAWAQDDDPFGDRDDDDEQTTDSRDNIQDEGSTFSGSIEKLLDLAGEKKAATSPTWSNFERPEQAVVERYDTLFEWRMAEEQKKAIPEKSRYTGDIDSLQKELEAIRPSNSRNDDYFFRHLHRADPVDSKISQGR